MENNTLAPKRLFMDDDEKITPKKLFAEFQDSDGEEVDNEEEKKSLEEFEKRRKRRMLPKGMVEVFSWRDAYQPSQIDFENLPLPTLIKVTIPFKIINELKILRATHKDEFGGHFNFNRNRIVSYEGTWGDEGTHDMEISSKFRLMFHTHPPYTSRHYSPPSEMDLGYIFNVSVMEKTSISHVVFAEEGFYVIFPNPMLFNLSGKIAENLKGAIDFILTDSVQELRMLLGYTHEGVQYDPKITIEDFIERINQMGFYLKLYPYPIDEKDVEIEITDNNKHYVIEY